MGNIKEFVTFKLPLFVVWILKQPWRGVLGFLKGVKHEAYVNSKPKSGMMFFFLLMGLATFSGRLNVMIVALAGFAVCWLMYTYGTGDYMNEYRNKYKKEIEQREETVKDDTS